MTQSYQEVIDGINQGTIKRFCFAVDGYAHYKNCSIESYDETVRGAVREVTYHTIRVTLTADGKEDVSFLNNFKEDYKLFRMGKQGTFTLKQLWDKIVVISIETR